MKSAISLFLFLSVASVTTTGQTGFTKYVNPFVGTGGHGHTFPGATLPFGMVQVSPDTRIDGSWDGCGGYHYSDSIIYGFSHTHLSGTGVSDYGDIMLMPMSEKISFDNKEYSAGFDHGNEEAAPGYYSVRLNNAIKVELTATVRTGFHRYTFPGNKGAVILDLTHRDRLTDGEIRIVNTTTIAVRRISEAWAREQHAYAFIQFSRPFKAEFNNEKNKVIFHFDLKKGEPLLTKVGYSLTGTAGAELNLKAESPGWNFDQVRKDAIKAWDKELGKIEVKDPDQEKLKIFYTALYHVMIQPNTAMDADGSYRGMDNKIHRAEGFTYYSVFSLWDTFRAAHPLYSIIDRKRTGDFIRTFLKMYEQGGRLPVWELASNETDCMIGYHSVSVIADAYMKGIRDFDAALALEAMKKSASWDHLGLPAYRKYGFLSIEDESESVSKTLEYAYDDWCIAQLARELKSKQDYDTFINRSQGWRNLLDPETGLMRPRKNGGWLTPFEPREVNNHFTEGNSWQYSFFVPQDVNGLMKEVGGREKFEQLLDALFTAPEKTTGRDQADITGLIGQYAHGNEPSHHIAYLYNYAGKPQKTKQRVHQILGQFYTSRPDGLIGNEDCGQMSAWYVLSAMGLYAVTPGLPQYTITEPFLNAYTVHLENGKNFDEKKIRLALYYGNFISHDFLTGLMEENTLPPTESLPRYEKSPIIGGSISFDDSTGISLTAAGAEKIEYLLKNGESEKEDIWNGVNIPIKRSSTIEARAIGKNGIVSKPARGTFIKNPHPDWTVELRSAYNPQYSAGGPRGIIDGIRGNEDWRKGSWQGFQGQDFEVIIDMKEKKGISRFSGTFLQDTRSWILMPSRVEYFISADGINFVQAGAAVENLIASKDYKVQISEFATIVSGKGLEGRYIKVKAYNFGKLPEWHLGAGYDAFIFVDELDFR